MNGRLMPDDIALVAAVDDGMSGDKRGATDDGGGD